MSKIIRPLFGENSDFPFQDDKFLIELLQKAMNIRKSGVFHDISENTYLRNLPVSQIELFDAMANNFPLVQNSQAYLHQFYQEKIRGESFIQLLDFGIGRGIQMKRLLVSLNGMNLKKVRLIGLDISSDSIQFTWQELKKLSKELDYELEIQLFSYSFENLNADFFELNIHSDPLIINASLSLHHIRDFSKRKFIMDKMAELKPIAFGLIEPNVASYQISFEERYENIMLHFGALFHYIQHLDLEDSIKFGIKAFLSNELIDGIAYPDDIRCENYDPILKWYSNFLERGFSPYNPSCSYQEKSTINEMKIEKSRSGLLEINYLEIPLLGILTLTR